MSIKYPKHVENDYGLFRGVTLYAKSVTLGGTLRFHINFHQDLLSLGFEASTISLVAKDLCTHFLRYIDHP